MTRCAAFRILALAAALGSLACGDEAPGQGTVILLDDGDEGLSVRRKRPTQGASDAGPEPISGASYIGGPCQTADDCDYADAVCVTGGDFSGGTCTLPCDLYCPDKDGEVVTFCVDAATLPAEAQGDGDGACFSRCDYGVYPGSGCREDYACVERPRANEPDTSRFVCLPSSEDPGLPDCIQELGHLGVSFEPVSMADESPSGHPQLTCHVEDPVILHPPIHGVDLKYYDGTPTPNVRMSCEGAKALVQTLDDVAAEGVVAVRHIGTYNCRVIAGTSTLSRHSFGDAIDLFGFEMESGAYYTLEDHWEHDTTTFATAGGEFLYSAAHRWYDAYLWNIILTPNYNAAHDNHFHVDLTPAEHYIGWFDGRYLGPAPYVD